MNHDFDIENEPALNPRPVEPVANPTESVGEEPALGWANRGDLPDYAALYRERRAATPTSRRWMAVGLAALVAGPFAVFGALVGGGGTFWVSLVIVVGIGPLVEEILKASGALYLAEQRPWLVPQHWVLPIVTLVAGLVFAVIENLMYLNVYIPDPTPEIIRWRWTLGPLLHGGASLIAGLGIARMWRVTDSELERPDFSLAAPYIIAAVVVHGLYNLTVTILEATGVIF